MSNKKSKLETLKEQWLIMKEDEENYRKFMENDDSEAFDKLVEHLIEHYKNKESEEKIRGVSMYDLEKIDKIFHESIVNKLSEKVLERNQIPKIDEELFNEIRIIEVPFGGLFYFLALEDEKPVLYVRPFSRMDPNYAPIHIIDEDSYTLIKQDDENYSKAEEKWNNFRKGLPIKENRLKRWY